MVLAELAQIFLRAVVASNRVAIREARERGRPLPALYQSGVRYEREPWGGRFEEFADILTVMKRKWGDCDDLCAARVAELQEQGEEKADARLYWRYWRIANGQKVRVLPSEIKGGQMPPGVNVTMHCEVRRANGQIEDPSRFLGL